MRASLNGLFMAAIACVGGFHAPSSAREPKANAGLHAAMEAAVAEEGLAGVVWATVTPDAMATGTAGLSDAQSGAALSVDSKVQTGSLAKTLVAVSILRLVTEKKLALDDTVESLLPELAFENPWAPRHPVLLRHLLDHTSGLDDARLAQVFSLDAEADTPLRAGVDRGSLRIRSRPGSRLSYSNLGYALLGMVIERVAGQRYEQYLDTHLLQPLGMRQSTFRYVSQQGDHADPRLAMGHFEGGETQATVPLFLRPAGQFTTTAADMARFARFLMGNGEIDGKPFVASSLLRAMGRPTTTEAVSAGLTDAGYGLGLNTRDRHGVVGHCHNGTTVGFRANFCLFPEAGKAFFLAMNADAETADYERFDVLLLRELRLPAATPAEAKAPPGGIDGWQGLYVPAPNRNESFAYLDRVLGFAMLRWDGRYLRLEPFQGKAKRLSPVDGWLFRAEGQTRASHVLLVSGQGRRTISDGFRSYDQISPWRIVPLWASLLAGVVGWAYLLLSGVAGVLRRRLRVADPAFIPFLAAAALLLPVPLFLAQSFLQLGDLTPASALLASVTGLLPFAMIFGLWRSAVRRKTERAAPTEVLAMFGMLQWSLVLATWGLLPLRLWV